MWSRFGKRSPQVLTNLSTPLHFKLPESEAVNPNLHMVVLQNDH